MEIFTITVVSSALLQKIGYYVKVVEENYYCDLGECTYPQVRLVFHSEEHYNKMEEIEKMFKEFFKLECYNKGKDYIHYDYLKRIIRYLKECEVMEVIGDNPDAFELKFYYIIRFKYILPIEEENMSERKKKYIIKVVELLLDKIKYE